MDLSPTSAATATPDQIKDRAAGALLGALVGDALGLGPHWYYDLEEMQRDYGPWITGYTDPQPHRYHGGMRAGQLSQSGLLIRLLMESIVSQHGYVEADFCRRLDEDFFPLLDGRAMGGPGGYTSQSIRETWQKRVQEQRPWGQTGGKADTTEAAERTLVLGALYALRPGQTAASASSHCALTQTDDTVMAMTTAYTCVLGQLIAGEPFDAVLSDKLMALVKSGTLPFHAVTTGRLQPPAAGAHPIAAAGQFSSPDALLTPSYMAEAAHDPQIRIEPAWKVSIVYGMPCAIYHQLPAAYYLAARFSQDFDQAVLHAVNGGGQNLSRALLTGALVGAQVGLSGIPIRWIEGLEDHATLVALARRIADLTITLTPSPATA